MIKKMLVIMLAGAVLNPMAAAQGAERPLTLAESITWAMQNNERIKAETKGDEAAHWELERAKGARALTVNFTNTSSRIGGEYWQIFHINEDPSSYFSNTFSATAPLYTGGKLEHTVEQAKLGAEISKLQVANAKQLLRYQVIQGYYGILACNHLEQAKMEAAAQLQEHVHNVEMQFAVGAVAKADVLRSEVALANAQQGLVDAENNTKVAQAYFNKLLGRRIQDSVEIIDDMSYMPDKYQLEKCIVYALERRPSRLVAQKAVAQAEEGVAIAKAGKKPNVSFSAVHTTYDTRIDEFDTKQWIVGVTASLNIFDGNMTTAQVHSAQARLEQAKNQEKDMAATVEFEVRQAYLNMKRAERNLATSQVAVDKGREDFSLASARYSVSLGTNLDVVDAQVALTGARTAYIESLYDYNVSKAALEYAMGSE